MLPEELSQLSENKESSLQNKEALERSSLINANDNKEPKKKLTNYRNAVTDLNDALFKNDLQYDNERAKNRQQYNNTQSEILLNEEHQKETAISEYNHNLAKRRSKQLFNALNPFRDSNPAEDFTNNLQENINARSDLDYKLNEAIPLATRQKLEKANLDFLNANETIALNNTLANDNIKQMYFRNLEQAKNIHNGVKEFTKNALSLSNINWLDTYSKSANMQAQDWYGATIMTKDYGDSPISTALNNVFEVVPFLIGGIDNLAALTGNNTDFERGMRSLMGLSQMSRRLSEDIDEYTFFEQYINPSYIIGTVLETVLPSFIIGGTAMAGAKGVIGGIRGFSTPAKLLDEAKLASLDKIKKSKTILQNRLLTNPNDTRALTALGEISKIENGIQNAKLGTKINLDNLIRSLGVSDQKLINQKTLSKLGVNEVLSATANTNRLKYALKGIGGFGAFGLIGSGIGILSKVGEIVKERGDGNVYLTDFLSGTLNYAIDAVAGIASTIAPFKGKTLLKDMLIPDADASMLKKALYGIGDAAVEGAAIESIGEGLQEYFKMQGIHQWQLPSIDQILLSDNTLWGKEKSDIQKSALLGLMGGFGQAGGFKAIGGIANTASDIKKKFNKEGDENLKQSSELAFEDTDKDLTKIQERVSETAKTIKNRLLGNEKNDKVASEQSASEFEKKQQESFKQRKELQNKVTNYETKSNNKTVQKIKNLNAKDPRNKIRLVEQRLNTLYTKENNNDITAEEQVEIKELEEYRKTLEEQFVKETAMVVTDTMAGEVLPALQDITTEQVDLLNKMLDAKTVEEFNDLQKQFINKLDLKSLPGLQKRIQQILNKDRSNVTNKIQGMGNIEESQNDTQIGETNGKKPSKTETSTQSIKNVRQAQSNQNNTQQQQQVTQQTNASISQSSQNTTQDTTNEANQISEPTYKTDEELARERIQNMDPYVFTRALVQAVRDINHTQDENHQEWDNYVKKNTVVRIDNKQLTDTSNVTTKKDTQYFNQDNIETFVVSSEIIDDEGNTVQYTNSYFEQEFGKAISSLVNAEKDTMNKNFQEVINALNNGNEAKANQLLDNLHAESIKDLEKIKDALMYIDFITFTNPNSKLAKKLIDIKRRVMFRLERTDKEIERLYKEVSQFNKDNQGKTLSKMESDNLFGKIANTTSSIFSSIRNKVNEFINAETQNDSDRKKLIKLMGSLENILLRLKDLRAEKSFKDLQQEVYNGLAKRAYSPILPSGIINSNGNRILFKGALSYLSIPIRILGSDYYGRVPGNDFIYSIIDKIIASSIDNKANAQLIENLKPILSQIAITPANRTVQRQSKASDTLGSDKQWTKQITLYDYLSAPNAESAKKLLTDEQLTELGITRNSVTFDSEVANNADKIREIFIKELQRPEIKERLSIAVNEPSVREQIETLLDIGLVLQAKVIFQNQNATNIDSNQAQFLAGEIAKFFDNKDNVANEEQKEANEKSYAELAMTAFALANELASQKNYKDKSLLTINDDNSLTFDKTFKKELADEYKDTVKEWDNILDTEVYSTNDKSRMEQLCNRLNKLTDSNRKLALLNMQNVSHKVDDIAIKVFKEKFGLDSKRDLVSYIKNAKSITSKEYNDAKEKFYKDLNDKGQNFIDEVKANPNSGEYFFNYIRIPSFETNEDGALVKSFKYIYVPELSIENKTLQEQFDSDILSLILTTSKSIFESNISKLESRTSELGYTLFVLANTESSLKNNGNIDESVKYYENKDYKTGKMIEIDYSKDVYYLLGLQDNGRVYIQDSATSPMSNVFLRDLTVHNLPKEIKQYDSKTGKIVSIPNPHYENWGGKDMSKVSNTELRDNKDYENQKMMVLNQLVRSLGIDYDKIEFDAKTIALLNDKKLETRIKNALNKVKSGDNNKMKIGYQELLDIVTEYNNKGINLLRQTYMSKGTINGKKIDIRDLLDRLLSNDAITVKQAIDEYNQLLAQVKGNNFKSDHPMLTIRAQESILGAIEGDKFNIQKLRLNYGSIYADGSATFMMENAIRLKTHSLNNALSRVSTNRVSTNGNTTARFSATIADIFNNYYIARDYEERVKGLIGNLRNNNLKEHLLEIIKEKKLDPHTLNLATVTTIMNFFGDSTLFTDLLSNSTILNRDTIKPPGTVSSYGSGIEGILNKFLELTFIKQEQFTIDIMNELSSDNAIKQKIENLLLEKNNKSKAEVLENEIIAKFQDIVNKKYADIYNSNNNKRNNGIKPTEKELEEETILQSLSNHYSNPDNVSRLLFNSSANLEYIEETNKEFEEKIQNLPEEKQNEAREKRKENEVKLNIAIGTRYFLFKNFQEGNNDIHKDKFNRNEIGETLLNNLKSDIDKILNYYQNFGEIKNGRLDKDVLHHSNELSKLILNKKNKGVFKKFFKKEMFDNTVYDKTTGAISNDYFIIKYKRDSNTSSKWEIELLDKAKNAITEFKKEYGNNSIDEADLKKMILHIFELKQKTQEYYFEHTPLSASAMPLLETPRQSSRYFNDVIKNVQDRLITQIYRNITEDLIKGLKKHKLIDSNANIDNISEYIGSNKELYDKLRTRPEIIKEVEQKTRRFLNRYFSEVYNDNGIYLNVFNNKPTEEQRIDFMNKQKVAIDNFIKDTLKLNSQENTNLYNIISFSTTQSPVSVTDKTTHQINDLRTSLPDVGALFNHPFEAFFLTAEDNGMQMQVFDAMFGTPVSIDDLVGNWDNAGFVPKHNFDNGYVLYKWFNNVDRIAKELEYNIRDFNDLSPQEQEAEIQTLSNIIRHYINITNLYTANTQNIKSLNLELAKDTEINKELIKNFKNALIKLKGINEKLSEDRYSALKQKLTEEINLTTIGNEDINVFRTKKMIDGKEQTIAEYISSKDIEDINPLEIINVFGIDYYKAMNDLIENALKDSQQNNIPNRATAEEISFFTKAKIWFEKKLIGNNFNPKVLSNNRNTNVSVLDRTTNVFSKQLDSNYYTETLIDDIIKQFNNTMKITSQNGISNIKYDILQYIKDNKNISVDEFINNVVSIYIKQYLFEQYPNYDSLDETNKSIIKQQIANKIGKENLSIHNLHNAQNLGKIKIGDELIDINPLFELEYELFNKVLNTQEIKQSLNTEINNISNIIEANNKINKTTNFVNPIIIDGDNRFGINHSLSQFNSMNRYYYANPSYNGNDIDTLIYGLAGKTKTNRTQNNNQTNTNQNNTNPDKYEIRQESTNTTSPDTVPTKEVDLDEYVNDIIKDIDDNFKNYKDDVAVMEYVAKLKESIKDLARNARMGLRIFYYQNGEGGLFDPNNNTISIFDTESKTAKLHEFIHAITDFALYSNTNEANVLKNKILAIHKQIKSDEALKKAIPDVQHLLENDDITNIAETLSIMLSKPSAVKALSERDVRIPFKADKGKTRLGSFFKALPLLAKYLFQLANHKLKREPSSSLEFLYKAMTDLSEINTPEGEANLKAKYDAKLINRLNSVTRRVGMAVLDRFLGRTESFKNLTPEEQKLYSQKIKNDIDKAISSSSLLKFGEYIKNYKGSSLTKGIMTALWLLKSTYYKNSNLLPFLTNPIQRAIVRETIADLRQRVIENTIFDAKVMLDFGIYSTNFLKKHINLINRATNARTRVNYEIEASKHEARQAIKTYLLFTPRLQEMLKDEKDFKTYSESVSKLVFHHNLGDYFVGYDNIPESELKELAYTALNSRDENVREQAQVRIDAKINEALYLLKIADDSDKAKVIRKTITDLAYTRYSDKLNKYGISNIEMALKRLDIEFNYDNDKQALQNLHQAITLKSIILPYQMKDSSSEYLQSKTNDVLNRYIHEKGLGNTELANDIQKSLQYIISFHSHKLEELYSKKILNRTLDQTQEFYKLRKSDKLYFMEDKDMYHKVSALDRFSEDAYYLESFKPYAFNPNKMVISIDPNNLDRQFGSLQDARDYYKSLGFKFEKVNDKGIETFTYEGFNQYSNSRETPSFIFQTLDHKGQVFKPLDEEDVSLYKPIVNKKFLEQMKKEFLDSSKEYKEDYVPNVNDTYGMSSSKSFAGSETMLRENMSNQELETLTNVDTTAESMFEQMEKYIMENKIKDFVNNQIFYQIIIGDEEIQNSRKASLDDKTKYHHTEVLFNIEKGRIIFNKELTEKYGIRLTKQDESDFAKIYQLVYGDIGAKSKVYIDTRLLPVMFGFNKANIAENVKKYPLAYRGLSAMQKALSFFIKEGKNNTIIRNPNLVITNATANFFGLVAEGVQLKEMESWTYYTEQLDKYQEDYRAIKAKEAKIKEINKVRKTQDEINEIEKLNKEIAILKESLKTNSVTPLVDAGMYSNIIEDAETTEWKWDEELIKSVEADDVKKNYLSEFMMTENSDAYRTLADMTRKGDFIPRVILYYHLINKKGYSKTEALDEVRDRFVNYSTPLFSPTGRMLEKTGIMMYQKYRFAVQKQALLALKNAPVSALAVISTQEILANMGFHTPWSVTSYLSENLMFGGNLPSGLWNMGTSMFSSVNRWKYVTP